MQLSRPSVTVAGRCGSRTGQEHATTDSGEWWGRVRRGWAGGREGRTQAETLGQRCEGKGGEGGDETEGDQREEQEVAAMLGVQAREGVVEGEAKTRTFSCSTEER